ncbi:MAG: glutamate-5-semialdehyde dehydrogenase [Candidatus Nanopelagicales bacterium]|nr:glutamate-5-semialdehyde dehydrogenase [Candidatus Nanopelagicales bacterium]
MDTVTEVAQRAKNAARELRMLTRDQKDDALRVIAARLKAEKDFISTQNYLDLEAARAVGTSEALIDRLTLDGERIEAIANALIDVAALPDPVGEVVRGYTLPNGLQVRQTRVPLGVVGMIYEARPNVTVDAAGLCLKSGNAALLRGSASAYNTNLALIEVMRKALVEVGIPADAIALVPGHTHESVNELMKARGLVDVLIPRGGASLIQNIVNNSLVPVIETGVGNCHVYVDKDADLNMAVDIVLNSKTQRVSVCNAAETLLVHEAVADTFLPELFAQFKARSVTVHGDEKMQPHAQLAGVDWAPANDEDWAAEYYSMDIAAGIVPSVEAAVEHILTWSSGHTEAIVSSSAPTIAYFTSAVDSAAVMVNASTRFTDGAEFGFGAEIGISTQKLHARGPMGLTELTTTTFIVSGNGQVRK